MKWALTIASNFQKSIGHHVRNEVGYHGNSSTDRLCQPHPCADDNHQYKVLVEPASLSPLNHRKALLLSLHCLSRHEHRPPCGAHHALTTSKCYAILVVLPLLGGAWKWRRADCVVVDGVDFVETIMVPIVPIAGHPYTP